MKVRIENVGRKKRALYVDDVLAASAKDIYELEAQIRITKLLTELDNVKGLRGLK